MDLFQRTAYRICNSHSPVDLRGRTSLAQAAALIDRARCFIGIESGPTCIAGALQAPAVGLFGRSYTPVCESVQPKNPRALYLQSAAGLEEISPETVIAAIERTLER